MNFSRKTIMFGIRLRWTIATVCLIGFSTADPWTQACCHTGTDANNKQRCALVFSPGGDCRGSVRNLMPCPLQNGCPAPQPYKEAEAQSAPDPATGQGICCVDGASCYLIKTKGHNNCAEIGKQRCKMDINECAGMGHELKGTFSGTQYWTTINCDREFGWERKCGPTWIPVSAVSQGCLYYKAKDVKECTPKQPPNDGGGGGKKEPEKPKVDRTDPDLISGGDMCCAMKEGSQTCRPYPITNNAIKCTAIGKPVCPNYNNCPDPKNYQWDYPPDTTGHRWFTTNCAIKGNDGKLICSQVWLHVGKTCDEEKDKDFIQGPCSMIKPEPKKEIIEMIDTDFINTDKDVMCCMNEDDPGSCASFPRQKKYFRCSQMGYEHCKYPMVCDKTIKWAYGVGTSQNMYERGRCAVKKGGKWECVDVWVKAIVSSKGANKCVETGYSGTCDIIQDDPPKEPEMFDTDVVSGDEVCCQSKMDESCVAVPNRGKFVKCEQVGEGSNKCPNPNECPTNKPWNYAPNTTKNRHKKYHCGVKAFRNSPGECMQVWVLDPGPNKPIDCKKNGYFSSCEDLKPKTPEIDTTDTDLIDTTEQSMCCQVYNEKTKRNACTAVPRGDFYTCEQNGAQARCPNFNNCPTDKEWKFGEKTTQNIYDTGECKVRIEGNKFECRKVWLAKDITGSDVCRANGFEGPCDKNKPKEEIDTTDTDLIFDKQICCADDDGTCRSYPRGKYMECIQAGYQKCDNFNQCPTGFKWDYHPDSTERSWELQDCAVQVGGDLKCQKVWVRALNGRQLTRRDCTMVGFYGLCSEIKPKPKEEEIDVTDTDFVDKAKDKMCCIPAGESSCGSVKAGKYFTCEQAGKFARCPNFNECPKGPAWAFGQGTKDNKWDPKECGVANPSGGHTCKSVWVRKDNPSCHAVGYIECSEIQPPEDPKSDTDMKWGSFICCAKMKGPGCERVPHDGKNKCSALDPKYRQCDNPNPACPASDWNYDKDTKNNDFIKKWCGRDMPAGSGKIACLLVWLPANKPTCEENGFDVECDANGKPKGGGGGDDASSFKMYGSLVYAAHMCCKHKSSTLPTQCTLTPRSAGQGSCKQLPGEKMCEDWNTCPKFLAQMAIPWDFEPGFTNPLAIQLRCSKTRDTMENDDKLGCGFNWTMLDDREYQKKTNVACSTRGYLPCDKAPNFFKIHAVDKGWTLVNMFPKRQLTEAQIMRMLV